MSTPETRPSPLSAPQRWRPLAIAALVVALGWIALDRWSSMVANEAAAERLVAAPLRVRVREAEPESGYARRRTFIGRVEARRESQAGFELAGRVVWIGVDEGARVKTREPIAKLDTARLEAERKQLEAARDRARAQLELASAEKNRVARARERDAVSVSAWDRAETTHATRAAALTEAQAAIARVDVEISKSTLRIPFDAIVARRFVDEGEVLAAGKPVIQLLESTAPEARVSVAGDSVLSITLGDETEVRIGDRLVAARVRSILPVRERATRSVDVVLSLQTDLGDVRRGDLAQWTIAQTVEATGYWLPVSALTESSRGLWACYVAIPDGESHRLEKRQLTIVHHETERVFVRGTLNAGERVVQTGLHRLVSGQTVVPMQEVKNAD
ncbi:MAG: efflux RND transporter periplasmic adaptor subunit [Planctomycetota bacterium]